MPAIGNSHEDGDFAGHNPGDVAVRCETVRGASVRAPSCCRALIVVGYPVVKKWLNYKEKKVIGCALQADKLAHVTEVVYRRKALPLLGFTTGRKLSRLCSGEAALYQSISRFFMPRLARPGAPFVSSLVVRELPQRLIIPVRNRALVLDQRLMVSSF